MTTATTYARSDEARAVAALLRHAERQQHEQRVDPVTATDLDEDDLEGLRLARDHGVDPTRLAAYRSLGRSRGLCLGDTLRAAMRGELRDVVEIPAVERSRRSA